MTLWFVLALMTAAAIFAVLWPLSRRESTLRSGSDVAVYRDQLEEIRRDQAAGLIGDSEAAAAQVEVSRRLHRGGRCRGGGCASRARCRDDAAPRAVAVAALVLLPVGALALYLAVGSPTLPGQPLASRAPVERQTIAQMVAQVEAHLAKNPNEGRGWEVVAPIYLRMGRFDDAVKARRNALALNGRDRRTPRRSRRGADGGGERRRDGGSARRVQGRGRARRRARQGALLPRSCRRAGRARE